MRLTKLDVETMREIKRNGESGAHNNSRQMKKLTKWGILKHLRFGEIPMGYNRDPRTIGFYGLTRKGEQVLQNDN